MTRRGWGILGVVAVAVVVSGASATAAVRITATAPAPTLQLDVPPTWVPAAGPPPPPVQLPPQGSLALQGPGGDIAVLHADLPRPIASVAKTMTAYVVLQSHPLRDAQDDGEMLTMSDVDVQDYRDVVRQDGSSLPVSAGEKLTERQLLLGLLLPSANNFADTLGRWTAGSVPDFVASMNRTAQQLGMLHTHFADPSGFSPQTVSTASDLVVLGRAVLNVPALMGFVGTQHAQLPDGTALDNLDANLGSETGWLGIKTGETPQAGGCLLFAVRRDVDGVAPVTMVGAVLGQTDLHAALDAAKTAVDSGYSGYVGVHASDLPPVHGLVTTRWGDQSGVYLTSTGSGGAVVRKGATLSLSRRVFPVPAGAEANRWVAMVSASGPGVSRMSWAVALFQDVPRPSPWWMLLSS